MKRILVLLSALFGMGVLFLVLAPMALAQEDPPLSGDDRATAFAGNILPGDCQVGGQPIPESKLTASGGETGQFFLDILAVDAGYTVQSIFIKGADAYNLYQPGQSGLGAPPPYEDLHAPLGPNGQVSAISFWFACGIVPDTTFTVDRNDDPDLSTTPTADDCTDAADDDCSLRGAINAANSSSGVEDTIDFDLGPSATIKLASTLTPVTDAAGLTINGGSADITVSGNNAVRVFSVNGGDLTLNNLTVADGNSSEGGGINNQGGTVTVNNSTFSRNSAFNGGAIFNFRGTATVTNSTISGNSADFGGAGGGIASSGTLTVNNSTISDNSAPSGGGGIFIFGGTATLKNTIVANSTSGGNCGGTIHDDGYNLDSDGSCDFTEATSHSGTPAAPLDPKLGDLNDNGGPTKTMALQEGSPAIDQGIDAAEANIDQRGKTRPFDFADIEDAPGGDASDIGAFELNALVVNSTGDENDLDFPGGVFDDSSDGKCDVDSDAQGDQCTLRAAIQEANVTAGADTITFDLGQSATITLASTLPPINDSAGLTIDGGSADITVSGNNAVRVFQVNNGAKLTLKNLTVADGNGGSVGSGGITNSGGTLTVNNSTFSGNSGGAGGGIGNFGTATLKNTIVAGNSAFLGGGIFNQGTLTVNDSTFSGNSTSDSLPNGGGGGIFNQVTATTTVNNSTFSGNSAEFGGGLANGTPNRGGGKLTVNNSTLSDNRARLGSGGIFNIGTLEVSNSTISGNSSTLLPGGAIINGGGPATLKNTIVAGNIAPGDGPDVGGGGFTSQGYNLIGDSTGITDFNQATDQVGDAASPIDPRLGPLDDNGGPTETRALLAGSPAIDKGIDAVGEGKDQRGEHRPFDDPGIAKADGGDNSDIGAFEAQEVLNTAPTAAVTNGQCTINTAKGTINLTLTDPDGDTLTLTLASNSNTTLVPNNNIQIGGSGNNRTITVTAAPKKSGTATLTFNLTDQKVTVPVVITVKVGSDKNETLNGTPGIDMIFGLGGKNTINGLDGNDLLCGGNSNDTINGGDGDDIIDGANGNDLLSGNAGDDKLTGGRGADSFSGGPGTDTATDFTPSQGDTQDTIP